MYYRSQGYRYPSSMRVPINYGGNAFSDAEPTDAAEEPSKDQSISDVSADLITDTPDSAEQSESDEKSAPASSLLGNLGSGSLFGGRIGSEELLILALVFLLSDTDADSDIIWLLLLLLFIK